MHAGTAKKIAQREHRKMQGCTVEDMEQAIWEHATRELRYYLGKDRSTIETYMTRAAKQFWSKERTDYMYFTGSYVYTPEDVRRILSTSAWSKLDECPDVDGRMDVHNAFQTLTKIQAAAVYKMYGLKEDSENFTSLERRNILRGIDNMTHRLNSGLNKQPSDFNELAANL